MDTLPAVVASIAILSVLALRWVPPGHVRGLYRHGRLRRMLQPGLHVVLPGLDRIGHRIDLTGQVLQFQEPLADAHGVRGKVYWQVLEPERIDPVIEQADQLIRCSALEALRGEEQPALTDHRALGSRLKRVLNGVLRERGVMVTRVELDFA